MSAPTKLTKKQKKALAFRERKGKGKETAAHEQFENDVPVMEDQDLAETEVADSRLEGQEGAKVQDKGRAQVVEGKKRKRDEASEAGDNKAEKAKSKKRKRDSEQAVAVLADGDQKDATEGKTTKGKAKGKQQRFILFVGELKPVSFYGYFLNSLNYRES
jgi:nucleolar protein 6